MFHYNKELTPEANMFAKLFEKDPYIRPAYCDCRFKDPEAAETFKILDCYRYGKDSIDDAIAVNLEKNLKCYYEPRNVASPYGDIITSARIGQLVEGDLAAVFGGLYNDEEKALLNQWRSGNTPE